MFALHAFGLSTRSQKVRLVLAETAIDFASREVDSMRGEQHAPDHLKLDAGHVVPTLVHDGRLVIESSLVASYRTHRQAGSIRHPGNGGA